MVYKEKYTWMLLECEDWRIFICFGVDSNMLWIVTSLLTKHNLFKIFCCHLWQIFFHTYPWKQIHFKNILTHSHTPSQLCLKRICYFFRIFLRNTCSYIFNQNGHHCTICNLTYIHSDCMNSVTLFAKCKIPETCCNSANFLWYFSLELTYPYPMKSKFSPYNAGFIEYQW